MVDYDSGPFCKHWGDPGHCDECDAETKKAEDYDAQRTRADRWEAMCGEAADIIDDLHLLATPSTPEEAHAAVADWLKRYDTLRSAEKAGGE